MCNRVKEEQNDRERDRDRERGSGIVRGVREIESERVLERE